MLPLWSSLSGRCCVKCIAHVALWSSLSGRHSVKCIAHVTFVDFPVWKPSVKHIAHVALWSSLSGRWCVKCMEGTRVLNHFCLFLQAGQLVQTENHGSNYIYGTRDDDDVFISWFTGFLVSTNWTDPVQTPEEMTIWMQVLNDETFFFRGGGPQTTTKVQNFLGLKHLSTNWKLFLNGSVKKSLEMTRDISVYQFRLRKNVSMDFKL